MSTRSRVWLLCVSGLVLALAAGSPVMPHGFKLLAFSDIAQCLLLLSGVLALALNVFSTKGRTRLFWGLMTLGVLFWVVYQFLWTYFEVYQRKDVPDPFVGDVVLFLHIVPMMAAVAIQPHRKPHERTTRLGSLDFSLLLVFWVYLWLFAVIPWQYVETNAAIYGRNLNALYLTEKTVFLATLGLLWLRCRGGWKPIYAQVFAASLLYSLSSYLANWAIGKNLYFSGSLYDVPLAASMAWLTAVGLFALASPPHPEPAHQAQGYGVWVARLGMVTIFSLPVFAAWCIFDQSMLAPVRTFRISVALATMLTMGLMVFLKQHRLDRELTRLLRTSEKSFEDLQGLQVQLVQSEKLASLGQLVGGAAHEINNPLTALLGYSDLLASTSLDPEQQALAQKIVTEVRHTKSLVASLLGFAKQAPTKKSLLDINSIAQTALKLSQPQLTSRNIDVHTVFASNLPTFPGDSNQLLQVCLHILNNAVHAMAETGGTLTLVSRSASDRIVLEFAHSGLTTPSPEHAFDPYYAVSPGGQRTGLGLSACQGIIAAHNGTIECAPGAEGGSLFRIELPIAKKAEGTREQTTANAGHPSPSMKPADTVLAARQGS